MEKVNLGNGIVFEGELKNGKPYGEGKMYYVDGNDSFKDGSYAFGFFDDVIINGKVNYLYHSGLIYKGDIKNATKEGKGYLEANGVIYEGDFLDGYPSGKGVMKVNGMVMEGDFDKFQLNGKGKITYPTGDVHEGDFVNGKREGYGKTIYADGKIYEGEYKDDVYNGKAILITPTCTIKAQFKENNYFGYGISLDKNYYYYGEFQDCKQNGQGMFKDLKDGSILKGQFKDGYIISGIKTYKNGVLEEIKYSNGKLTYLKTIRNDGAYEEKYYRDGEMYGHKKVASDGTILKRGPIFIQTFETKIVNGKEIKEEVETKEIIIPPNKNRFKVFDDFEKNVWEYNSIIDKHIENLKEPSKLICNILGLDKYEGKIKNRLPHGKGKYKFFKTGNVYEGSFNNGLPHGKGVYTFEGGSVYDGDFKDGFATGKAEIKYKDGAYYKGQTYKLLHHGKGKYVLPSGATYEGEFKFGAPDGYGKLVNQDGSIKKGYFSKGKFVGENLPN